MTMPIGMYNIYMLLIPDMYSHSYDNKLNIRIYHRIKLDILLGGGSNLDLSFNIMWAIFFFFGTEKYFVLFCKENLSYKLCQIFLALTEKKN